MCKIVYFDQHNIAYININNNNFIVKIIFTSQQKMFKYLTQKSIKITVLPTFIYYYKMCYNIFY